MKDFPEYSELFSRNIGILTEAEQERLRRSRVALPGVGGVGGSYAVTLARMGVGEFHISDLDVFEPANFNRQAGASLSSLGRKKTEVIRELILSINPHATVRIFEGGVHPGNVSEFLEGARVVLDGLDFYAIAARRVVFPAAEERGIHVITSGPFGLTTTLHVFGPGAMPFEQYFDFASCRSDAERLAAFATGLAPRGFHLGQIDLARIDIAAEKAPSFGTAIQLCAGLACTEAMRLLIGRPSPHLAPRFLQFDPVAGRLARGRLWFGNRGPLQRLKRKLVLLRLARKLADRKP